jgi:hypothetical protein
MCKWQMRKPQQKSLHHPVFKKIIRDKNSNPVPTGHNFKSLHKETGFAKGKKTKPLGQI